MSGWTLGIILAAICAVLVGQDGLAVVAAILAAACIVREGMV